MKDITNKFDRYMSKSNFINAYYIVIQLIFIENITNSYSIEVYCRNTVLTYTISICDV